MKDFTVRYASTMGSVHQKMRYNNQDHVIVIEKDDYIIGIVSDGCGGCPKSEVGAILGPQFLATMISLHLGAGIDWKQEIEGDLKRYLNSLVVIQESPHRLQFIYDHLLFTIVGFVATAEKITVFHCGDGVIILDKEIRIIDQHNKPGYFAYNLLEKGDPSRFIFEDLPSGKVRNLVIATDGLYDYLQPYREDEITGSARLDSDFLENDSVFGISAGLDRFVTNLAENEILPDDTSLVWLKCKSGRY